MMIYVLQSHDGHGLTINEAVTDDEAVADRWADLVRGTRSYEKFDLNDMATVQWVLNPARPVGQS